MDIDTMHRAIWMIDADLIEAADAEPEAAPEKTFRPWMKWAAAAAAFIVVAAGAFIAWNSNRTPVRIHNGDSGLTNRSNDNTVVFGIGVKAAENIQEYFGHDEHGWWKCPDDYAGMWIDDERLVIALTDISPQAREKYLTAAGEYASGVRFVKAEYSYNLLYEKCEEAAEYLKAAGYYITGSYVSDTANRIVISVREGKGQNLRELADTLSELYGVPIMLEIGAEWDPLIN